MQGLLSLFIGSLVLSLIHAAIPNHWLTLVALSKAERWTFAHTLWITAIAGATHTVSTIVIGILVGLAGQTISSSYQFLTHVIAPIVLVGFGIAYLIADARMSPHRHHSPVIKKNSSGRAVIASLFVAMFFSPCLEIEAYYFTAGAQGWAGIAVVSLTYLVVTVAGMTALVGLAYKGVEKVEWHYLEHHEKKVSGLALIALGLLAYFVEF